MDRQTALTQGQMVSDLATLPRQLVSRSHVWTLLGNGLANSEILAQATRDGLKTTHIERAIEGVKRELAPVNLDDKDACDPVMREIGYWVNLAGPNWSAENRREFIEQAFADTCHLPCKMLMKALKAVRYRKIGPWEFLPWIADYVERDMVALQTERRRLGLLLDILNNTLENGEYHD